MLVLTRKPQETIRIGDHITVTVIKTKGNAVRIGIEAPKHVTVLRGELLAARDFDGPAVSRDEAAPLLAEPLLAEEAPADAEEEPVHFRRVGRTRVVTILPDLLGSGGPLREMLAGRQSVTT